MSERRTHLITLFGGENDKRAVAIYARPEVNALRVAALKEPDVITADTPLTIIQETYVRSKHDTSGRLWLHAKGLDRAEEQAGQ